MPLNSHLFEYYFSQSSRNEAQQFHILRILEIIFNSQTHRKEIYKMYKYKYQYKIRCIDRCIDMYILS